MNGIAPNGCRDSDEPRPFIVEGFNEAICSAEDSLAHIQTQAVALLVEARAVVAVVSL